MWVAMGPSVVKSQKCLKDSQIDKQSKSVSGFQQQIGDEHDDHGNEAAERKPIPFHLPLLDCLNTDLEVEYAHVKR